MNKKNGKISIAKQEQTFEINCKLVLVDNLPKKKKEKIINAKQRKGRTTRNEYYKEKCKQNIIFLSYQNKTSPDVRLKREKKKN